VNPKAPKWYRSRRYIHFDVPTSFKKAHSVVSFPEKVARHAFYPFLSFEIVTTKIKENDAGKGFELITKPRPIAYAAHMDSHIYSYYAKQLSDNYEARLEESGINESVLAFRSLDKSNIEFAHDAFQSIQSKGNCGVVALDIKKFFDTLDHLKLKEMWAKVLGSSRLPDDHYAIYRSLTKHSKVNKEEVYARFGISKHNPSHGRDRICTPDEFRSVVRKEGFIEVNNHPLGIPQGSPLSALLSNIYMLDFDIWATSIVNQAGGSYYRYCDDMLFIVPTDMRNEVAGKVRAQLKLLEIDINTKKTDIHVFSSGTGTFLADKPLQYLGFLYDGQKTIIRSAALARYSERMKQGVKLAKRTMKKHNKIRGLNGQPVHPLYKKKLYSRYSHLGQRNFIRYAHRAAKLMDSRAIKRQIKPLWKRLIDEIEK
jgi:RNA-directed DNA polymerase